MSDQFVSRGQPERSVALLWRAEPRPGRGPKRGLTIDAIAVRAIELADTEGLAGLSMRRLADALGVRPMTLYTYLPAKAELLDVMLDAVYGEIVSALKHSTEARSGNHAWRAGLESRARADWALYRRHPWILPDMGTGETAYPGVHAMVVSALTGHGDQELLEILPATTTADRSRSWVCMTGPTRRCRQSPTSGV
jgi:AcrR family transcriptional regulator